VNNTGAHMRSLAFAEPLCALGIKSGDQQCEGEIPNIHTLAENLMTNQKSTKLIHVRHPFSRLYSAWGDRLCYWKIDDSQSEKVNIYANKHNNVVDKNKPGWTRVLTVGDLTVILYLKNK